MPRQRRWFPPGVSAHIIKRGNNRAPIFSRSTDYGRFLTLLQAAAQRHATAVHGFALMTNHFHLIATPELATSIPQTMKQLGERYSQYFNSEYLRTGTPWEGRYRAFLLTDERYWLTCLRYIELNPVRARMVTRAEDYEWSSYTTHAFGSGATWLDPHPLFTALGASVTERGAAYQRLCDAAPNEDEVRRLRAHRAVAWSGRQQKGSDPGVRPLG